jgi:hypothetical protein
MFRAETPGHLCRTQRFHGSEGQTLRTRHIVNREIFAVMGMAESCLR